MATYSILHFFLLSIALFSVNYSLAATNPPKPHFFSLHVKKDPATNQYYTSVGIGTPRHNMDLVIDLAGQHLWYDCDTGYNSSSYIPVACGSKQCPQSSPCIGCNNFPFKPGCTNDTCGLDVFNPFADSIYSGDMGDDVLFLPQIKVPHYLSACSDSDRFSESFLVGLVKGAKGMLGLARTQLAFQTQLSSLYKLPNKFSLCLPSSNEKGFGNLFVGGVPSQKPLHFTTPLVINPVSTVLPSQKIWVDCEKGYVSSTYKPVRCGSAQCALTGSGARGDCYDGPKPGCNNNTCVNIYDNSISSTATTGEVTQDIFSIKSTDGSNPGKVITVPQLIFTCGGTFMLEGLAHGVNGMAGLGRSKVSLPSQLASAFSFHRKFAICLGSNGVVFFGDSPYVFLPGLEFSKSLTYTPLIKNPVSTASASFSGDASTEYFVGVKGIRINEKAVKLNTKLLSIDKEGRGGTKISTVNPYTVLETSIYNAVVGAFGKALAKVPRVAPVAPFGLCFNSTFLGNTRVGPGVPAIDFVLQKKDVVWRFFGYNSMVRAGSEALCLGFVDGGVNPRTSVVIGGHQIEDTLLQFDLAKSRLGFSGLLLGLRTNSANFNFTSSV
ncbi:hypothetical protein L6164_012681 [Bauhinia variegata]|uniref:Uncharacterized protein n=1 Tax=Bauhinia variegata TaxID=167791 RepID=A0ACB9PAX4_BAUVA|nr:hypothetical protein L6164_012681 [Bauhinia variegata]